MRTFNIIIAIAICFLTCCCVEGFQAPHHVRYVSAFGSSSSGTSRSRRPPLFMATKGGRGFGESKDTAPKKQAPAPVVSYDTAVDSVETSKPAAEPQMNAGQRALAQMRKDRQGKKDDELRAIQEIRSIDEQLKDDPGAAAIPERVAQRMGQRMIPFVGIPLFGGMGVFVGFWYFATYKDVQFEPIVVATATVSLLVVSLLGITYSVISASWDDDQKGSALGVDEFKKNVGSLKEGLQRTKENQLLRERMIGLPEEEIEMAVKDLERREMREAQKKEAFKSRMEKDLS